MSTVSKGLHSSGMIGLASTDITISQLILLNIIFKKESPKMTDLSGELDVTLGNVTTMIDKLVKEGFVFRTSDPQDRRIVRACLTPKGKGLIKKAEEQKKKNMGRIFDKMSVEDRHSLLNIMQKLAENIKNEKKGEN